MTADRTRESQPARREHGTEPHGGSVAGRLNWLRAGVLGANDGIISTAGLVIGVAAATTDTTAIATAGIAGLTAGAVSMALGEYVSVSAQRDTERALVARERSELARSPKAEFAELVGLLKERGMSDETARIAAEELTNRDALRTHLSLELGIDQHEIADPWSAALSSAVAFIVGATLPLLAILLPPTSIRVPVAVGAVLVALALTGAISAGLGEARRTPAVARLLLGGAAAMAVTYAIGEIVGVAIG